MPSMVTCKRLEHNLEKTMARPKQNPTLNFVVGLYREMKPTDRRTLMLELMALTFDIEFPQTIPVRQRKARSRKEANPPEIPQTAQP